MMIIISFLPGEVYVIRQSHRGRGINSLRMAGCSPDIDLVIDSAFWGEGPQIPYHRGEKPSAVAVAATRTAEPHKTGKLVIFGKVAFRNAQQGFDQESQRTGAVRTPMAMEIHHSTF